jgi:hypothetical protein
MYIMKILLHGVETWRCLKTEGSKIQATEMTFLKAIMGKTERHRIRNAYIREELRKEDTQNQIEGNRLRWFGNVKRMDEYRIAKRVLEMKMSRKETQRQPTEMVARPSQDRRRKTRMILGEVRRNAGTDKR